MAEWIYETNLDNSVRYVLGINSNNPLICIGVNPSTASPEKLDNTLKSVNRFALSNGFDGWIMLNLYPQRATLPDDIHLEMDLLMHQKNMEAIENILSNYKNASIWVAWGTLIEKREFLKNCLLDLYKISQKYSCNWISIGNISKNGHPHHPLYLNRNAELNKFEIENYIQKLKGLPQSLR
jgi:hypothetical protein